MKARMPALQSPCFAFLQAGRLRSSLPRRHTTLDTFRLEFLSSEFHSGDVAQLGERGVRNAEARSSILLISTNFDRRCRKQRLSNSGGVFCTKSNFSDNVLMTPKSSTIDLQLQSRPRPDSEPLNKTMKRAKGKVKLICVVTFTILGLVLLTGNETATHHADAFSDGPPPGFTGAPGEQTCANCHSGPTEGGAFAITPPPNYVPGQTYQITIRHENPDMTRDRWGFQLTALAGTAMAGSFSNLPGGLTQVVGGVGRDYIEHTTAGTF